MLLYLDRSDERKGIFFFPRRERESNLSWWHDNVGLEQFFTYLNGLSHLFIFMNLFVALFTFIREMSFNLNWLRVSAVDSIGILAGSPPASSPSSPAPPPSLPRHASCYVLRKPDIFWRSMSICKDVFWVVAILSFYWDTSFISQSTNLSNDCSSNEAYLSTCFNFK